MSAGTRLRDARKAVGMTQADLATVLDITPAAISQWETDITLPDVNKLVVLSITLRVSIDWILKGDACEPIDETLARVLRLQAWAWGKNAPDHLPSLDTFRRRA